MRFNSLVFIFILSLISGCATVKTSTPPPVSSSGTTVEVSKDGAGMNDYPMGTYKIPDSQVLVVKHRGMSNLEGGFGLLGVMAANSDGKKKSRDAMVGTEKIFALDIASITHDVFRQKLSQTESPSNWQLSGRDKNNSIMEVTPYVFISPMAAGNARIYVFLKSELRNSGSDNWLSRYIYHGADIKPLTGSGSWSENDAALFREAIEEGVIAAIDAMLIDAESKWPLQKKTSVTARFAMGMDEKQTHSGIVLKETNDVTIFTPHISDAVIYYGIHIMPQK